RTHRLIHKHTLGQLQLEQRRRQSIFVESYADQPGELGVLKLMSGYVERQSWRGNVLVAPARELRTGGIQYPPADIDDQAARFRGRHEFARRPHPIPRGLPPNQRLDTD